MRYRDLIGPLAVMPASYGAFEYLRDSPYDLPLGMPRGHFYVVSFVSPRPSRSRSASRAGGFATRR